MPFSDYDGVPFKSKRESILTAIVLLSKVVVDFSHFGIDASSRARLFDLDDRPGSKL